MPKLKIPEQEFFDVVPEPDTNICIRWVENLGKELDDSLKPDTEYRLYYALNKDTDKVAAVVVFKEDAERLDKEVRARIKYIFEKDDKRYAFNRKDNE